MKPESGTLPLLKDGQIDTRPLEVEEWLEGLPFADFQRTGDLLHKALGSTNQATLKPGVRRQLVDLYHQPYQYYLDNQINAGTKTALHGFETMQQSLRMMKQLAADLALASRLTLDDAMNQRSLWGQSKFQIDILQRAMYYLSHALIFNFMEYAPTPRNVWKQLNSLYKLAEDLQQHKTEVQASENIKSRTTVEQTFGRILLSSAVDPYHLPFGAIWEIYEQLGTWTTGVHLNPFHMVNQPNGLFVIDLDGDSRAIPYNRFNAGNAGEQHRILDATVLEPLLKQHARTSINSTTNAQLKLSPTWAGHVIAHMNRAWFSPPKRYFPRVSISGSAQVTCGMSPTHFHLNNGQDLLCMVGRDMNRPIADGLDVSGDEHDSDDSTLITTSSFILEQWDIINEGPGGYALTRNTRPTYTVRVGEIIGIKQLDGDHKESWSLGVTRWLMADNRQNYRLGIQLLARDAQPVAVRATGDNTGKSLYRGFLIEKPGETVLITKAGFYRHQRSIEIVRTDKQQQCKAGRLQDTDIGFEQFEINR